jgi:DNA-binding GntR family transcriptional regulator
LFRSPARGILHFEFSEIGGALNDVDTQTYFRAEPLHDRAITMLRDMIVKGTLKPREPISERDLCERFGISRTPLREALKVLASEGLIELLPRRGAIVTALSRRRLAEQFRAVALIEADAARTVATSAPPDEIAKLRAIHDRLIGAFEKKRATPYYRANEAFHRALVVAAGNDTLADIHATLVLHLHRARFLALTSTDMNAGFAHAHEGIMAALERGDGEAAAAEVTEHQREVSVDVLGALNPAMAELD